MLPRVVGTFLIKAPFGAMCMPSGGEDRSAAGKYESVIFVFFVNNVHFAENIVFSL